MIEAAIEKGGKHLAHTHEAWVAIDSLARRRERRMLFAIDEEPAEITSRVKETLDERGRGGPNLPTWRTRSA